MFQVETIENISEVTPRPPPDGWWDVFLVFCVVWSCFLGLALLHG